MRRELCALGVPYCFLVSCLGEAAIWASAGDRLSRLTIRVQSAAAEDVVEIEGSSVRFTHPLFASAIYSGAAPWRRREAHRAPYSLLSQASPRRTIASQTLLVW